MSLQSGLEMKTDSSVVDQDKSSANVPCLLGKTQINLPKEMVDSWEIFDLVCSPYSWNNALTEFGRLHLMRYLPEFGEDTLSERKICLQKLFRGENFSFGNPRRAFFERLSDGYYSPKALQYKKILRKAKYQIYRLSQERYYMKLLRDIVHSRHRVFEQLSELPPSGSIDVEPIQRSRRSEMIEAKVEWRYQNILSEIRAETGVSSDEEEEGDSDFGQSRLLRRFFHSEEPHSVVSTADKKPRINKKRTFDMFAESHPEMTEPDYKSMLDRHRRRRDEQSDAPELDTRNMDLQDIILRTNPSRRAQLKVHEGESSSTLAMPLKTSTAASNGAPSSETADNSADTDSFFAKIRDLFSAADTPDQCLTQAQLISAIKRWEEVVSEKSGNESADEESQAPEWFSVAKRWSKLVPSALKFLANAEEDDFIPYIELVTVSESLSDSNKDMSGWRWIGSGRDTNPQLFLLCQQWLQIVGILSADDVKRSATIGFQDPTADILEFQRQEREHYSEPHKAYVYKMNGIDYPVAPVKGVYTKNQFVNMKARDHVLLVPERPFYVNIVSIVRDAVARLRGGEGTRAEIVNLARQSQFLVETASESTVHAAVSGALDRLHYDKDPCVKFDSLRKVWIYLHKGRTIEDHEAAHAAHHLDILKRGRSSAVTKQRTDETDTDNDTTKDSRISQSSAVDDTKEIESKIIDQDRSITTVDSNMPTHCSQNFLPPELNSRNHQSSTSYDANSLTNQNSDDYKRITAESYADSSPPMTTSMFSASTEAVNSETTIPDTGDTLGGGSQSRQLSEDVASALEMYPHIVEESYSPGSQNENLLSETALLADTSISHTTGTVDVENGLDGENESRVHSNQMLCAIDDEDHSHVELDLVMQNPVATLLDAIGQDHDDDCFS